jgi:RNA polymerase sigma factor (sigma-70 family)
VWQELAPPVLDLFYTSKMSSVRGLSGQARPHGSDTAAECNDPPKSGLLGLGRTTEDTLMARYVAGDVAAFRRLFELIAPRVHGFFLRSFADACVADDLTQNTFLKLHRARGSYRPDLPLKPWVFTIAASVRRDELRRLYRLPPHVGEGEIERAEVAAGALVASESTTAPNGDEVRDAIGRLPESQRVVLHLHTYEELTFQEIADILGTTPGAVRVRASRAYERLREELRDDARSSEGA